MSGLEEMCVDCGAVTDMWVRGWDGKYRCMTHIANGPRPTPHAHAHHCPTCTCRAAHHCPTCTCRAAQLAPGRVPSEEG